MRQSKSLGNLTREHTGLRRKNTQRDLQAAEPQFPASADAYELLEDCGRGVSATVWRARCLTNNEIVAVKILNLEAQTAPLEDIVHEAQTMKAYKNDSILKLYVCFVHDTQLWMVTPFCWGGSVAHIMRYSYPDGLSEPVIATIMKEVISALAYIHSHGDIHRDVKCGNVLVDADGHVKLGDLGVAASMERSMEEAWTGVKPRLTFVGTPCWMAPEVLEQAGYSTSADMWSAGITLLEMAHGHAPFSKLPPMKVLLMTLQGPPPQLEAECGGRHFSRGMREVVASCLNKDPAKRPTAKQLLAKGFFRQAKDADYLKRTLLAGLPPLPQRCMEIRMGKGRAATLALENDRAAVASHISYITDVAQWDFNCTAQQQQQQEVVVHAGDAGAGRDAAAATAAAIGGGSGGSSSSIRPASSRGDQQPSEQQQQQQQDSAQASGGDVGPGARDVDGGSSVQTAVVAAAAAGGCSPAKQLAPGRAQSPPAAPGAPPPPHRKGLLTCYAGDKPLATFPVSVPDTPQHSPMHSRPTTPELLAKTAAAAAAAGSADVAAAGAAAQHRPGSRVPVSFPGAAPPPSSSSSGAAAVAGAKTHGRFTFIEGATRYQGPELGSDSPSATAARPKLAAAAAAGQPSYELARQRSVSSPDMRSAAAQVGASSTPLSPASPQSPLSPGAAASPRHEAAMAAAGAASPSRRPQSPLQQQHHQLQHKLAGFFSHLAPRAPKSPRSPPSAACSSRDASPLVSHHGAGSSSSSLLAVEGSAAPAAAGAAAMCPLSRQGASLTDIYTDSYHGGGSSGSRDVLAAAAAGGGSGSGGGANAGLSPRSYSPRATHSKAAAAGGSREHPTAAQIWQHVKAACAETAHVFRSRSGGSLHSADQGHSHSPDLHAQQQQQPAPPRAAEGSTAGLHAPAHHHQEPERQQNGQAAPQSEATAAAAAAAAATACNAAPSVAAAPGPVGRTSSSTSSVSISSSKPPRYQQQVPGRRPSERQLVSPPASPQQQQPPQLARQQQHEMPHKSQAVQQQQQQVQVQEAAAAEPRPAAAAGPCGGGAADADGANSSSALADPFAAQAAALQPASLQPGLDDSAVVVEGWSRLGSRELSFAPAAAQLATSSSSSSRDKQLGRTAVDAGSSQQQQQGVAAESSVTFHTQYCEADRGQMQGAAVLPSASADAGNAAAGTGAARAANGIIPQPQQAADAAAAAAEPCRPGQQPSAASPSRRHKGRFTITET